MPTPDTTPELLSPAGNWDCARAAVAAGADAIYFGLPQFNARLRADNFTDEDLPALMEFLHDHGVKGFVAMNTLIFTNELEAAEAQLRKVAAAGVDALIIQDLGLAKMAREIIPEVELHASTQMTITSPEGLAFIESMFPMERAVLARELSVREIERFRSPRTPLEVFVHGALCVAYSGQCLTSESLGQRSANRGECAQACRMPYEIVVDGVTRELGEVRYLLSPQDLAAVDMIPDLVKAGVKSFKIEGRLKSPEYVTAVTRVYRKALDAATGKIMDRRSQIVDDKDDTTDPSLRISDPQSTIHDPRSPITSSDRYALEMTFSRGLSSGWLAGTNHPYLTHGRFGKKRGPLLGTIADCGPGWIILTNPTGVPIAAGDGVVFDAGENRDLEQGARIWKIEGGRIIFHKTFSGINFDRIQPGHTLYKTSDPKLESELRRFWQNTKLSPQRSPLHLTITGKIGSPLTVAAVYDRRTISDSLRKTSSNITSDAHPAVTIQSPIPLEAAAKRPLDTETLTNQLGRLGDTLFELASLDNQLEGDCYLPVSTLNQLRRELVEQLEQSSPPETPRPAPSTTTYRDLLPSASSLPAPSILAPSSTLPASTLLAPSSTLHASSLPAPSSTLHAPSLSVLCRDLPQLSAAVEAGADMITCDFEDPRRYKEAVAYFRSQVGKRIVDHGSRIADEERQQSAEHTPSPGPASTIHNPRSTILLATPRILKPGEMGYLKLIEHAAPDGLLLRNLAALDYYKDRSDLIRIGDFSLNVANPITARLLMEHARLDRLTVSYDLNITQAIDLLRGAPADWFELTLHQHMPMFHMEHCVFCVFLSKGTTYKDCGRPCETHVVHLRDRVGQLHRLQADVGCRNTLFNGRAQTGARFFDQLRQTGLRHFRVELLDEDQATASQTIRAYQKLLHGETHAEDLMQEVEALEKLGVTEGTLVEQPR